MSCSDTSLKPQDGSLIYGSIEGDNDKIQPPVLPANAPIDPQLLEKWISSYKTKEQSVLKK